MRFSTNSMKENRFVSGDPSKGERLGLMTRRRMQEQVDLFVKLGLIPAPVPLDKFVSFAFLPSELQALSQ
jgi:NitT/TauT family transport system substrate-binding protein